MMSSRFEKTASRRTRWSAARIAYLVHSAAGLWFTALLSVIMITGTIAVFTPEIDRLVFPALGSTPSAEHPKKINAGKLYDALTEAYPGMGITHIDAAPYDRYASATTTVTFPGKVQRIVAVDSYSGEVRGEVPVMTVKSFIGRMHAILFQGLHGFYLVNFCGLMTLVATISGLIVYRRFWRGFFKRPRFGRSGRILLGDLHRLMGVWTLLFLLIIGGTGTWYFYNFPLVHLGLAPNVISPQAAPEKLPPEALATLGPETPERASGVELVNAVKAAYPDMTITGLMPPINLNMPFVVHGHRGEYLRGKEPNAVYLNPFTAEITGADLAEDEPYSMHVLESLSQVHHGELLPPRWGYGATMFMKTIWFLCGAGASFLCISGLLIYLKRTRRAASTSGLKRFWHTIKPWGGPMGVFKYVNVLALGFMLVVIWNVQFKTRERLEPAKIAYAAQTAGPFTVSLTLTPPPGKAKAEVIRPGARVMAHPHIADNGFTDARTLEMGLTGAKGSSGRGMRVKGAEKLAFAPLRLPKKLENVKIWIALTQWDGTVQRIQWPLTVNDDQDRS